MSQYTQLRMPPKPFGLSTAEASLWDLDGPDGADRAWRHPIFARLPQGFADRLSMRYRKTWKHKGRAAANTELRESSEGITRGHLKLSASDQEVRDQAEAAARYCTHLAAREPDPLKRYAKLAHYVEARGLTPPPFAEEALTVTDPSVTVTGGKATCAEAINPNGNGYRPGGGLSVTDEASRPGNRRSGCTLAGANARMCAAKWWRKGLRRELGRMIEHHAIRLGFVHRHANKYVSNTTLQRVRQQWRLNALAMESVELENEDGDVLSLDELVERSNANPYVRRSELMTRMAGTERYAESRGDVGLFLTLTCPSRFHARYALSGDENPSYDDSTPKDSQAYLCGLWARIRAAWQRQGLNPYGIRVAEPHHDGTPHWHLMVFVPEGQKAAFVTLCRDYALKDSPEEPGALEKRFGCKAIDHSKGTATGYIAKYISKNIDGHGLDADEDGDEITSSAERVRAWASVWGIRQFQFFGGPPVTIWRELRRLPDTVFIAETIEAARKAADAGDWQAYMEIMGGAGCDQSARPIQLATQWSDKEGTYGEPLGEIVFGVRCGEVEVQTRLHVWTLVQSAKQSGALSVNLYGNWERIRIEDTVTDQAVTVTDTVAVTRAYTCTYMEEVSEAECRAGLG